MAAVPPPPPLRAAMARARRDAGRRRDRRAGGGVRRPRGRCGRRITKSLESRFRVQYFSSGRFHGSMQLYLVYFSMSKNYGILDQCDRFIRKGTGHSKRKLPQQKSVCSTYSTFLFHLTRICVWGRVPPPPLLTFLLWATWEVR